MSAEIVETSLADRSVSAVSWAAICGGALIAIATTLILVSLGSGFGLGLAAPWGQATDTIVHLGIFAGIWLVVVQWLSSAIGGYVTGRMRVRWVGLHTHEVFFRDTAHGFMTWSLATVIMAAVAAWVGANVAGLAAGADKAIPPLSVAYDADTLYRTVAGDQTPVQTVRDEAARTLATSVVTGTVSQEDRDWLIASISARTGASAATAAGRVDAVLAREHREIEAAKTAVDEARVAAAKASLLTALSLLVGAFIASVSAAIGGQLRDKHS